VIDLHSHILPGLDDGAHDDVESLAIARAMAGDGVRIVAATPHVRDDYPTPPEAMEDALARLQDAIVREGIAVDVVAGGELALDRFSRLDLETLQRFGLGGNKRALLIEYPYTGWSPDLEIICGRLRDDGVVPVIAHPERNPEIQRNPAQLEALVGVGALVQLTAASVDGRLGRATAQCARRLLDLELAHLLASDAHSAGVREAGLSSAVEALGGGALAHWLTCDVPEAILDGVALPARPPGPRRRRRFLGRVRS
jgi:protein-tyrosine phosphatase